MKRLKSLILIALLCMACSTSYAGTENSDADVAQHISAGAVIAGLTTYYMPKTMHPGWRWAVGVAAGSFVAFVKETSFDKNPDFTDWSQWAGGAVLGATIISFTF
jgi:hypothetical protein